MTDIQISIHAIARFIERSKKLKMGKKDITAEEAEEKILKLLSIAVPDKSIDDVQRVKRTINNGFQEATYMEAQGWRFVIVNNKLSTVERIVPHQN